MELKGKVIDFLGVSITEGVGVADRKNNRYDNVLKKLCDLKEVYNYGIGGTRLAYQTVPSESPVWDLYFCGRAYRLDKSADIVVVYGGVNDYIHGDAPFGQFGDKTPATFCGAVSFLMRFLKSQFAGKTVVFMTPARLCYGENTGAAPSTHPYRRANGRPLPEYVEIIKQTGAHYGIPVLDLYANLGIDPNREEDKETYTADGLHFNDAGHRVIAERLKAFLEAL